MTQLNKRDYAQLIAGTFRDSASGDLFTQKSQDTHPVFPPGFGPRATRQS